MKASVLVLAAFLSTPMVPATAAAEQGLAIRWPGSLREALVFRTEDADGVGIFAPAADGGFTLQLLPGLGPGVVRVAYADASGDGNPDLLVERRDGSIAVRLGDGHGQFAREPFTGAVDHAMHHALAADVVAAPTPVQAAARALLAAGDLPSAGVATADLSAFDQRDERAGFVARFAATGHFREPARRDLALVSGGSRPRLRVGGTEMLVPNATVIVNVGMGGLVYSPTTVNINAGDTVRWAFAGGGHTVTSGPATCVVDNLFCSPSNTNCATAPTSPGGATYDRIFSSAGTFPYFCRPHCSAGMRGTVNVAAAPSPGAVPDGATVPGVPLTVNKGAGDTLDLSWGASCTGAATGYGIYEGTLPIAGTYNHAALLCTNVSATSANVTPGPDGRYYLIAPQTATSEGSYGTNLILPTPAEIPPGSGACHPQVLSSCP